MVVRGIYRLLTLPEVVELLPDHIHRPEECPLYCYDSWDGLRRHLARARRDVSPHLHYLDVWMIRKWLGQMIVVSCRSDVAPCSRVYSEPYPPENQRVGKWASVIIPRKIVRRAGIHGGRTEVLVRTMHLREPIPGDVWADFLDPYCTSRVRDGPDLTGWWHEERWAVWRDGLVRYRSEMMVWAELVKETRLP